MLLLYEVKFPDGYVGIVSPVIRHFLGSQVKEENFLKFKSYQEWYDFRKENKEMKVNEVLARLR